ncbi:hypothetical protein [Kitasatospora sp. NPDC006786]|uniref:hypothetical protein n=1 Tax=unclassified Kitasatospora TaxID=2633591 RepID=UPI0033DCC71F
MSDDEGSGTVIPFPGGAGGGVGFAPPPLPEAPPPRPAEPAVPPVLEMPPAAGRRSPLETLASLSGPAEMVPAEAPALPAPADPVPAPVPGEVPAAFRSEAAGEAAPGPGLGSLSLAAMLAVSVAAMRGIHSAVTAFRASREQRKAVAEVAEKAGQESKEGGKKGGRDTLTPSHEWGRRSLDRHQGGRGGGPVGGPGGGRSGGGPGGPGGLRGAGSAPAPGPAASPGGGTSGARKVSGTGKDGGPGAGASSGMSPKGKDTGKGGPSGSGKGRSGSDKGPAGSTGGPVHRTSQGGGPAARGKGGGKNTGSGGGGTNGKSGKNTAAGQSGGGQSGGGRSGKNGGTVRTPDKPASKSGPGRSGAGSADGTSPGTPGRGKGGRVKAPTGASGTGSSSGTLRKGKGKGKGKKAGGPNGAPAGGRPGPGQRRPSKKRVPGVDHGTWDGVGYNCGCRRCRRFLKRRLDGRVSLGEAIHRTAAARLKARRKNFIPAWKPPAKKRRKKGKGGPASAAAGSAATAGSTRTGSSTGPGAKKAGKKARGGWGAAFHRAWGRAKKATAPPPGPGGTTTTGRSTPFGAAGMASAGGETITVVREDRVGDAGASRNRPPEHGAEQGLPATGPAALGPAPVKHTRRPGTRRPRPMPPVPSPAPAEAEVVPAAGPSDQQGAAVVAASVPAQSGPSRRSSSVSLPATGGAVPGMSAEHATEITIDDVLDELSRLTQEGFAAHDTCVTLAERARKLRYDLEDLAAELRTRHNVIGRLTSTAMSRLAESMDLLARKADEMKISSLEAAEQSESADQAMNDHYKPIQRATADAGLNTPSARVHNEN